MHQTGWRLRHQVDVCDHVSLYYSHYSLAFNICWKRFEANALCRLNSKQTHLP